MKIVVAVGLFVLVACLHQSANGAQFRGKTDNCEKRPAGFEKSCHKFLCDEKTGLFEIHTCGVTSISCQQGQQPGHHAEDLAKPYPKCCAEPYCRDV